MTLVDDFKLIKSSQKDLREFGWTVGGVLLALGLLLAWKQKPFASQMIVISLGLIGAAFLIPRFLKPVQVVWMSVALCMGWVMSRVILCLVFYLVMTPLGFILRGMRKDLMRRGPTKNGSDWIERPPKIMNYRKQF